MNPSQTPPAGTGQAAERLPAPPAPSAIDTRQALERVLGGESLSRQQMESLIGAFMDGAVPEAVAAALLVGLRMKGETVDEIAGAASAMRARALTIPHNVEGIIDTCGTGGDGKGTFNVSTAAALVAAAAGVPVAKHGNRSISSRCGSADVLATLGVAIDLSPEEAGRCLKEVGISFLFAPHLHPAVASVMPVRRALGVRTVFNVLGPLTNPAGARRQVIGVYEASLVEKVARVLAELGADRALVVHGADGMDELSTTGTTHVAEWTGTELRRFDVDPEEVGLRRAAPEELLGGDPDLNAELFRRVVDGETGPLADITAFNAGAALWIGDAAPSLADGVHRAQEVLASGAVAAMLESLCRFGVEGRS